MLGTDPAPYTTPSSVSGVSSDGGLSCRACCSDEVVMQRAGLRGGFLYPDAMSPDGSSAHGVRVDADARGPMPRIVTRGAGASRSIGVPVRLPCAPCGPSPG